MLSNLDKYIAELREPMDVVRIFSKLSQGQQHNLIRALRCFLNFMEVKGVESAYLNSFRKAIPQDTTCIDLYVPDENEIVSSIRKLSGMPLKYQALYSLLLDSGLRVIEAVKLMNEFDSAIKVNGFHRCTLGYFRG
jgi:intergrase/recombinase